jgi:hypothetical protein
MNAIIKITNMEAVRIYAINTFAFLSTFTSIDVKLQTGILVLSLVYTLFKTIALIKNEILNKKK